MRNHTSASFSRKGWSSVSTTPTTYVSNYATKSTPAVKQVDGATDHGSQKVHATSAVMATTIGSLLNLGSIRYSVEKEDSVEKEEINVDVNTLTPHYPSIIRGHILYRHIYARTGLSGFAFESKEDERDLFKIPFRVAFSANQATSTEQEDDETLNQALKATEAFVKNVASHMGFNLNKPAHKFLLQSMLYAIDRLARSSLYDKIKGTPLIFASENINSANSAGTGWSEIGEELHDENLKAGLDAKSPKMLFYKRFAVSGDRLIQALEDSFVDHSKFMGILLSHEQIQPYATQLMETLQNLLSNQTKPSSASRPDASRPDASRPDASRRDDYARWTAYRVCLYIAEQTMERNGAGIAVASRQQKRAKAIRDTHSELAALFAEKRNQNTVSAGDPIAADDAIIVQSKVASAEDPIDANDAIIASPPPKSKKPMTPAQIERKKAFEELRLLKNVFQMGVSTVNESSTSFWEARDFDKNNPQFSDVIDLEYELLRQANIAFTYMENDVAAEHMELEELEDGDKDPVRSEVCDIISAFIECRGRLIKQMDPQQARIRAILGASSSSSSAPNGDSYRKLNDLLSSLASSEKPAEPEVSNEGILKLVPGFTANDDYGLAVVRKAKRKRIDGCPDFNPLSGSTTSDLLSNNDGKTAPKGLKTIVSLDEHSSNPTSRVIEWVHLESIEELLLELEALSMPNATNEATDEAKTEAKVHVYKLHDDVYLRPLNIVWTRRSSSSTTEFDRDPFYSLCCILSVTKPEQESPDTIVLRGVGRWSFLPSLCVIDNMPQEMNSMCRRDAWCNATARTQTPADVAQVQPNKWDGLVMNTPENKAPGPFVAVAIISNLKQKKDDKVTTHMDYDDYFARVTLRHSLMLKPIPNPLPEQSRWVQSEIAQSNLRMHQCDVVTSCLLARTLVELQNDVPDNQKGNVLRMDHDPELVSSSIPGRPDALKIQAPLESNDGLTSATHFAIACNDGDAANRKRLRQAMALTLYANPESRFATYNRAYQVADAVDISESIIKEMTFKFKFKDEGETKYESHDMKVKVDVNAMNKILLTWCKVFEGAKACVRLLESQTTLANEVEMARVDHMIVQDILSHKNVNQPDWNLIAALSPKQRLAFDILAAVHMDHFNNNDEVTTCACRLAKVVGLGMHLMEENSA